MPFSILGASSGISCAATGFFREFGYQFDIYDPSNSDVIAAVPLSTRFDVRETVAAAREAAPGWALLPGCLRVDYLLNAIERIERNIEEIAALEARDTGAPVAYVLGCLSSRSWNFPISSKTSPSQREEPPGRSARSSRGAVPSWSVAASSCRRSPRGIRSLRSLRCRRPSPVRCSPRRCTRQNCPLASSISSRERASMLGLRLPEVRGSRKSGFRAVGPSPSRSVAPSAQRALACVYAFGPQPSLIGEGADLAPAVEGILRNTLVNAARPGFGGIVVYAHYSLTDALVQALQAALANVRYGPPVEPTTSIGPMISDRARIERRNAIAALQAKSAVSPYRAPNRIRAWREWVGSPSQKFSWRGTLIP